MPKIAEKQSVLNGRGSVVRFASGTSNGNYVYREWDNSIRNYRTKHILEAKTMAEAIALVPQIAIELAQEIANKPTSPNYYRSSQTSYGLRLIEIRDVTILIY